ncbi:hypothetical protein C8Q77DRAFT_1227907, partial [Trametes polyzona]
MTETTMPGLEGGHLRENKGRVDSRSGARERVQPPVDARTSEENSATAVAKSDARVVESDQIAVRTLTECAHRDQTDRSSGDVQRMVQDEMLALSEGETNLANACGVDDAAVDPANAAGGDRREREEVAADGADMSGCPRVKEKRLGRGVIRRVGAVPVGGHTERATGGDVSLILSVAMSVQSLEPFERNVVVGQRGRGVSREHGDRGRKVGSLRGSSSRRSKQQIVSFARHIEDLARGCGGR